MRVAFPLDQVERIIRAVAIAPVPGATRCLHGVIDVAGDMLPVYDLRRLLGLRGGPLRPQDRIVLTRAPRCGLVVDGVAGTVEPEAVQLSDDFALRAAGLRGVTRGRDGLLLVHDLRRLLALERAIPIHPDG